MKIDEIRALPDEQLKEFIAAAELEKTARAEKHKVETVAKIKELAAAAGITVSIGGMRGRPPKTARGTPSAGKYESRSPRESDKEPR